MARLVERPQAVGELASQLPVSRSAVSQHLRVLNDAGLVRERADGTRRIYGVNPAALEALRNQLDTYWRRALERYVDLFASDNDAGILADTSERVDRRRRNAVQVRGGLAEAFGEWPPGLEMELKIGLERDI